MKYHMLFLYCWMLWCAYFAADAAIALLFGTEWFWLYLACFLAQSFFMCYAIKHLFVVAAMIQEQNRIRKHYLYE